MLQLSSQYGVKKFVFASSAAVYGPRQGVIGEGGVISIFMERAVQGKELMIFGDGNQTRDFIYVKDLANAIYKAADKNISGRYNLSTNSESSVNDLIEALKKTYEWYVQYHKRDELCDQVIIVQNSYEKIFAMMTKRNSQNPKEVLENGIEAI